MFETGNTIDTVAMTNTRSSKSHMDINLVSAKYLQTLSQPMLAEQMDGTRL